MRSWGAVGAGCALAWLLVWSGRTPEAGLAWRLAFVGLHLGAFAGLVAVLRRWTPRPATVVVGAVLFRVIALPMLPTLSDDGYRYLWDGRLVVEAGVSPYEYRPSDPALAERQAGTEYQRMNSQRYHTVYPPVSQLGFAAAVALGGSADWRHAWWVWKAMLVLCELGAIVVLLRRVRPEQAALYAWSPLAVMEIAGQGHSEALVLLGLAGALLAGRFRWPVASLGLTLAAGVKLYPAVWLPQAWRREGRRGVAASGLIALLLAVPFWNTSAAAHMVESLGLFFGTFDEYAAPYRLLKSLAYPLLGDSAGVAASRALGITFLAAVAAGALTDDGTQERWRTAVAWGALAFVLTASTLHPWYWLPALFLMPWLPCRTAVLWLVGWSSAGYLGYALPGASDAVTVIGWGGAALLAICAVRRGRALGAPRQESPRPPGATTRPGSDGTR